MTTAISPNQTVVRVISKTSNFGSVIVPALC